MMNDISVVIYSYKGRNLESVVNNLRSTAKNSNLYIDIHDQFPLYRKEHFETYGYNHIFWDHIYSPIKYKNQSIKNFQTEYSLIISDRIMLEDGWDDKLVSFIKDSPNSLVSGNGVSTLVFKNLFYISRINHFLNKFEVNNFIDRDLIFGKTETIKSVEFPEYLKYNGEEEVLSLRYWSQGIDVYAAPTSLYSKPFPNTIETLYTPFSKDHFYNEAVSLMTTGKNNFDDISNNTRNHIDFSNYHKLDLLELKKLPFEKNDVLYDPLSSGYNKLDAKKFMTRTKALH
jgi:hypothetical protein